MAGLAFEGAPKWVGRTRHVFPVLRVLAVDECGNRAASKAAFEARPLRCVAHSAPAPPWGML